jgi:uncharacterized protein (TIGR02466 family)
MRQLFATPLYEADLTLDLEELAHSIRSLAEDDGAGRRWAKEHGYKGYTSYASLNDLPRRDPVFADLAPRFTRHAAPSPAISPGRSSPSSTACGSMS